MNHSIKIKIVVENKIPSSERSAESAMRTLLANIERGSRDWIALSDESLIAPLKSLMADHFKDTATIRDGVSHGCYGATDGSTREGITLYLDPLVFPERWVDDEGDEIVNIAMLLHNHAELIECEDVEGIEASLEALGLEGKSDNTYNYLGNSEDDPCTLQDVNFTAYSNPEDDFYGAIIVILKFHCGGDPRGNYTREYAYKFDEPEEFYNVFHPSKHLTDDDN